MLEHVPYAVVSGSKPVTVIMSSIPWVVGGNAIAEDQDVGLRTVRRYRVPGLVKLDSGPLSGMLAAPKVQGRVVEAEDGAKLLLMPGETVVLANTSDEGVYKLSVTRA